MNNMKNIWLILLTLVGTLKAQDVASTLPAVSAASIAQKLLQKPLPVIITLAKHTDWIHSVAFSPDGTKVVTASDDGTAKIWNAATGQLLHVLEGYAKVRSAAFSPDGTQIVTASFDTTARIWDVATGKTLYTLGHTSGVLSAAFSPDGTKVVTASKDGTAKIWDISPLIIGQYFSKNELPLQQQALLVNLDTISKRKNGAIITRNDLFPTVETVFGSMPKAVVSALKVFYKVAL